MAFAGRQQEGRALLLSVRAGRGVVLSAPPGYSKSALLEEVRPALEAWSKVVWCDKIAPFGSFLKDLFRGLWDARIPVEGVPLSRDLEADTHKGRTLLKLRQNPEVSQSPKHPKGVAPVELLKDWALPPAALPQTPLSDWDTRPQNLRAGLRNVLQDVKLCARQERPRFVGRTGELLARALRDPGSVNLYRALLWGALRRKDRGEDRFEALWNALDRVLTDLQEGFAKKPGALLIARLRESGLRALLLEGPQYRVA